MADLRPFAALRYQTEVVGDLSTVLAPPYDIISPQEHRALFQRSPYNIVRLELPGTDGSAAADPYSEAGSTLRSWLRDGVLARDDELAFYLYEQEFEHPSPEANLPSAEGRRLIRRTLFGRLRLEPWEAGVVRPHERTMPTPKEDRLRLLRATRTNVSPVFALYQDPEGAVAKLIDGLALRHVGALAEAATPDGQRHRLAALTDPDACAALSDAFRRLSLYVADGHHRYETALAYREERLRVTGPSRWAGDEPENFVLAGLTSAQDPGLMVLPIHRLLSLAPPADALDRLGEAFEVENSGPAATGTSLQNLLSRLRDAGKRGTAFAAVGLEAGHFTLLTLRDLDRARAVLPPGSVAVWGQVDSAILRHVVLERGLGLSREELEDGAITYAEDAGFAVREVLAGRQRLAFLLNPTPVDVILAVADAGERLPQKSTYFHPKLPTGLVLNQLD